jgi:alpha-glucosidase
VCIKDCDEFLLGPFLLAAPVVEKGGRRRRFYLPAGPQAWFDFHTEASYSDGVNVDIDAPIDRLPLFVPAGGIIPMTATADDFSRLHDEPSRCLRLFPGPDTGSSTFTLVEDDGITEAGPVTHLHLDLSWNAGEITLRAHKTGTYPLPTDPITVCIPKRDKRSLKLRGDAGINLVRGAYQP